MEYTIEQLEELGFIKTPIENLIDCFEFVNEINERVSIVFSPILNDLFIYVKHEVDEEGGVAIHVDEPNLKNLIEFSKIIVAVE